MSDVLIPARNTAGFLDSVMRGVTTHISPSRARQVPTGELIIEEGDAYSGTYEVITGAVLISRLTLDGKRHVLSLLGPGDMFGFDDHGAYDHSAEAITVTNIRSVTAEMDLSTFRARLVQTLQRQLKDARTHTVRLQRRSADEKLACFVLHLPPENRSADGASDDRIMLSLTDAADYLSLRIETVSRGLSKFRKQGLIASRARGKLTILDRARLDAIAYPSD